MKRKRSAVILVLSMAYAACTGEHPAAPLDRPHEDAPAGLNLSNVVSATSLGSRGAAAQSLAGSAYVSAAPQTFAGDYDRVSIRNESSPSSSTNVPLLNGGFDPERIDGQVGDDISVSLFKGATLLSTGYVKIPPRRPPRIVRTIPEKGRVDVALNIAIEVVFTEPIDNSTIGQSMQLLRNGVPVAGSVHLSANGLIAEFSPATPLESGESYTLSLTQGVRDLDGDPLSEPESIDFTTGAAVLSVYGTIVVNSSTVSPPGTAIDPGGYVIQIDARPGQHIASNGSLTFNDVLVGEHFVSVTGLDDHCVGPGQPSSVDVRVNQVTTVDIEVTCSPPPPLEGILAFVSDRDGNAEIYTSNADGTDLRRLTNNSDRDFDPAWSPDGKRIAFARSDNTAQPTAINVRSDIYIMDADGSNVVQLTHSGTNGYPTWSPDGRRIAYRRFTDDTRIVIQDLEEPVRTPEIVSFDRGWNTDPAWSPDGKTILFSSDWYAFDFATFLFSANTDGSTTLPKEFPLPYQGISTYYYLQPSWSPDGTRVAFAECDYFYICWGSGRIVIANADASGYRRLVEAVNIESTTWSPDGTTVAYSSGTNCRLSEACHPTSISYVTLDGRKGLILSNAYSPSWKPK